MSRTVLFAVILALGAGAASFPSAPAYAQEKKGFFSFFNRQGSDGSDSGGPVHLIPGTQGASTGAVTKVFGFGKGSNTPVARYEDSPLNAERARQASNFMQWNSNELAKVNASTQSLIEQMKAEQAYNAQAALQKQAQKIAQAGQSFGAGPAPAGGNMALVQAMRESARAQVWGNLQSVAGMAPPAAKAPPVAAEKPVIEKSKREQRPQGLFNRITE